VIERPSHDAIALPSRRDSRRRGALAEGLQWLIRGFVLPLHVLVQSKMLEFTRSDSCKARVDEQRATLSHGHGLLQASVSACKVSYHTGGSLRLRAHREAVLHYHSPTPSRQSALSALGDPYFSDITPPPPGGSASQIPSLVTLGSCLPSSVCCGCYRMVPHSLSSILRSLCLLFQFA